MRQSWCQRVLTAGRRARGAVLDGGQGGICLEEVSHNLCALHLQVVSTQPANESQRDASRGADSREKRALGMAAYQSDLVAVFDSIKLAMMVAESTVRPFPARKMVSTGSVPLSFMISRGCPSRLHTGMETRRQRGC